MEMLTPIQNNLLTILKRNGALSRKDLVNRVGSPRTTIYDNLLKLQKQKIVEKFAKTNGKRGRPLILWRVVQ